MEQVQEQTENKPQWQAIDPATLGSGTFAEKVDVDPNADAFAVTPPIPEGKYTAVLGPSSDPKVPLLQGMAIPAKGDQPARNIIRINAELTLVESLSGVNPELLKGKNKVFELTLSTAVRKKEGLPTTSATSLLGLLGFDVPASSNSETIAATLKQVLETKSAQIGVEIIWKAGYVKGEGKNDRGYNNPGHFEIVGMRNFPLLAGGTVGVGPYSPVATVDGQEYRAKAYIAGTLNEPRLFTLRAKQ